MNYWLWGGIGSAIYMLTKKPESAVLVPKPTSEPPLTQVKTVVTNGRKYTVTRAGLGIFKIQLASDPSVFELIGQTGPLQSGGDPAKLAQLRLDEQQFPAGLFTS